MTILFEFNSSESLAFGLYKSGIPIDVATDGGLINAYSKNDVGSVKIKSPVISQEEHDKSVNYIVQPTEIVDSAASWILQFQNQLRSIRDLQDDWNGYGSKAPNSIALINSQTVLDILHQMNFSPMAIAPSAEDGIAISFAKANKNAIIECYNDGDILAITYKGAEEPELKEIGDSTSEIAEALDRRIYNFLYGK
jgi:hypothetical protein